MTGGLSIGVGTLRYSSSYTTSFLRRRWASAGPERSGPGSFGAWTSGRGVYTRVWWGVSRWKGLPERAGLPPAASRRTKSWPGVTTTQCCLISFGRLSAGPPTGRGGGVSSQTTNARISGDRLQRSSGRSTRTFMSHLCKTPRVQPSGSMRKYPKRYPSTSRMMTSRGSHQISPVQQVCWERRQLSCEIDSFSLGVCLRS